MRLGLAAIALCCTAAIARTDDQFEKEVRPLLRAHDRAVAGGSRGHSAL